MNKETLRKEIILHAQKRRKNALFQRCPPNTGEESPELENVKLSLTLKGTQYDKELFTLIKGNLSRDEVLFLVLNLDQICRDVDVEYDADREANGERDNQ